MSDLARVQRHLVDHSDAFVADLKSFLAIPSVSADSRHKADCRRAAEWVAARLRAGGLASELVETPGHPIVYAEWTSRPARRPSWSTATTTSSPPIRSTSGPRPRSSRRSATAASTPAAPPTTRARCFTHINSAEAWMQTAGKLPVNLKFVIEGEEEVGSNNLDNFLTAQRERLKCDVAVISDTGQYRDRHPGHHLRPAGDHRLRDHCPRPETGPAQRRLRRLGGEPGQYARPADRHAARRPGPRADPRLLRRRRAAHGRGAGRSSRRCPFDEAEFCRAIGVGRAARGGGLHDAGAPLGAADVRRERHLTAAIRARARRRSSRRRRQPRSPAGWCRTRIRTPDRERWNSSCSQASPPGMRMDSALTTAPRPWCAITNSPYMAAARDGDRRRLRRKPVLIREGGSIPVVGCSSRFWESIRCCSAGARTATICTAPTSTSAWKTSTAARPRVRRCGKLSPVLTECGEQPVRGSASPPPAARGGFRR